MSSSSGQAPSIEAWPVGRAPRLLVIVFADLRIGGGGDLDLIEIAGQLRQRGWEVHLQQIDTLLSEPARLTRSEVEGLLPGIPIESLPALAWMSFQLPIPTLAGYERIAREMQWSDVVLLSQYYGIDAIGELLARIRGRPFFLSQTNTLFRGRPARVREVAQEVYTHTIGRLVRRHADGVRTCNTEDGETIRSEGQKGVAVVHPISPSAYDLGSAPPSFMVGREDPEGDKSRRMQLIYAGRMTFQKGPDLVAGALAQLLSENPSWADRLEVHLAGRDRLIPSLDQLRSRCPGMVIHLGILSRSQLAHELDRADLLLMPSRYESFGVVAVEAQLRGTPVLATDVRGLRDAVALGGNNIRVAPTAQALAAGIRRAWGMWNADPDGWRQLRRATRELAYARFGPAARSQELDAFARLMAHRLSAPATRRRRRVSWPHQSKDRI